jgi:hypothetical protein
VSLAGEEAAGYNVRHRAAGKMAEKRSQKVSRKYPTLD